MAIFGGAKGTELAARLMEYRVYVIGDDGHFIRAVHLVCSDDSAALAQAKQLVDGHDIELWQGDRKLATFGVASIRN